MGTIIERVPVAQGAAYAANGQIQVNFGSLSTGPGGRAYRYLRALLFAFSITIANASGGAVTVARRKMWDAIASFSMRNGYHNFILGMQGSDILRHLENKLHTRLGAPAREIANGANDTFVLGLVIPFFDQRLERPDELNLPVLLARDMEMVGAWCNGAAGVEFGAGMSITAGSLSVTAIMQDKAKLTIPPLWTLQHFQMAAATQEMPGRNQVIEDLAIVSRYADAANVETAIAAAALTHVRAKAGGAYLVGPGVIVQELIDKHNVDILDCDKNLPEHALATTGYVPVLERSPRGHARLGDDPLAPGALIVETDGTTTTHHVVMQTRTPQDLALIASQVRKTGIALPDDFDVNPAKYLRVRGANGSDISGAYARAGVPVDVMI